MAGVDAWSSASDSDHELGSRGSDSDHEMGSIEEAPQRTIPRRHAIAIVFGSLALAACLIGAEVTLVHHGAAKSSSPLPTARALLDRNELHDAVTDQMMAFGRFNPDDKSDISKHVAAHLSDMARRLDEHSPELTKQLDSAPLTKAQMDSVINRVRHFSDPRVLSVGLDVAEEVKNHHGAEGADVMQRHLLQRFEARVGQITQLANEVNAGGHKSHFANLVNNPKMVQLLSSINRDNKDIAEMMGATPQSVSDRRLLDMPMGKDMKLAADALSAMAVILGDILGAYENIMNDMGKNINMAGWIDEALKFIGDLGNAATCAADMADKTTTTSSMSTMSCFTSVAASGMAMLDAFGMGGDDSSTTPSP